MRDFIIYYDSTMPNRKKWILQKRGNEIATKRCPSSEYALAFVILKFLHCKDGQHLRISLHEKDGTVKERFFFVDGKMT